MKTESEIINQNVRAKLDFVELWAEYVRTHPDKEWTTQQNVLINSQLKSTLTREQYLAFSKRLN